MVRFNSPEIGDLPTFPVRLHDGFGIGPYPQLHWIVHQARLVHIPVPSSLVREWTIDLLG